jgi:hypothetical protein
MALSKYSVVTVKIEAKLVKKRKVIRIKISEGNRHILILIRNLLIAEDVAGSLFRSLRNSIHIEVLQIRLNNRFSIPKKIQTNPRVEC